MIEITETKEIPVITKLFPKLTKMYVYPICDIHLGDAGSFDEHKFRGYLKIISEVPEAFCVLNGDLINCGLPNSVGAEDFWKQEPLTPQDQNDCLVNLFNEYNIKDKILAVVGGSNHPGRAMKLIGHNYDKQFAQDLGILDRYVEPIGMIFIGLGKRAVHTHLHKKGSPVWYSLLVTHGWAGGRLAGSSINSTRDLGAIYAADCVITSHRHLDAGTKDEFYFPDFHSKTVTKIKRMYVSAGTFMKYAPYAMRKGLRPNGTGTPRIRLDGFKKDVHVSI